MTDLKDVATLIKANGSTAVTLAEAEEREYFATHTDYNKRESFVAGYLKGYERAEKKTIELETKLEQAVEIIRECMRFEPMIGTCSFYSEEYEKTKKKAEQFLKENE